MKEDKSLCISQRWRFWRKRTTFRSFSIRQAEASEPARSVPGLVDAGHKAKDEEVTNIKRQLQQAAAAPPDVEAKHVDHPPYVCGICEKTFKARNGFRQHFVKYHNDQLFQIQYW